jgi:hypothetical protein
MPRLVLMLSLLILVLGAPARAGEPGATPPAPQWEFSLAPYLWMAGLEGTVDADRHSADVDVSFSDIWDVLDIGVLAAFEARRGKFSVTTNAIYMKISPDAGGPVGPLLPIAPPGSFSVRVTTQELIFELRPAWEVLSLPLFGAGDERRIALDLGPGARAFWIDNHIDVKLQPGVPVGPFQSRFDESGFWVDLVGAARVRAQLTENIGLVVSGDYGGFDIGSSSHRTWSAAGYLSYALGEHWDLAGGWRTLELERGGVDLEMSGPLVGVNYRF